MEIPEIDKQVTREVMAELKGKVIPSECSVCHGKGQVPDHNGETYVGVECDNCGGTGTINLQY